MSREIFRRIPPPVFFNIQQQNTGRKSVKERLITLKFQRYDVIIVGTGISGIYTALNLSPELKILMLSKRELTLCNSALAQGGVAAVMDKENDSYELHIKDTLIAGHYKNNLG